MTLRESIANNPYQGYSYSYPHKTAYRDFNPVVSLADVWRPEDKQSLFLYIHIPFCEMRCGFCNLFTMANPEEGMVAAYLRVLEQQAQVVNSSIGEATFSQLAIGGGTPSFLEEHELEKLFDIVENTMRAIPKRIPVSFEVSPKTVTKEKLVLLHKKGVDRISIGVQSFFEEESKLLGRPQRNAEVHRALSLVKAQQFDTLNIDLIYGGASQSTQSWQETLKTTIEYSPEEIYLYPLYVRPLTGLDKMKLSWDNFRLQLYRQGRDYLQEQGYEQVSMRMFRKRKDRSVHENNVVYCCQEDGMVGLGSGARSYTQAVHYSSEYAVGRKGVKNIIQSFINEPREDFSSVRYGIFLSQEEQMRRYIIKSLLHGEGLNTKRFYDRYACDALSALPDLASIIDEHWAISANGTIKLTPTGMELSDSIGPALYSQDVLDLMEQYELR